MRLLEPVGSRRELVLQLAWFGVWVFATALAVYLSPNSHGHGTHQQLGFPPCPTVLLFDKPCPGCGLTTSWAAIVHGDIALAWRSHPFGPLTYGVFTASAWICLYGYWKVLRFATETRIVNLGALAIGAAFLAFGIARAATTTGYAHHLEQLYMVRSVDR